MVLSKHIMYVFPRIKIFTEIYYSIIGQTMADHSFPQNPQLGRSFFFLLTVLLHSAKLLVAKVTVLRGNHEYSQLILNRERDFLRLNRPYIKCNCEMLKVVQNETNRS